MDFCGKILLYKSKNRGKIKVSGEEYKLSEKQRILGMSLYARRAAKQTIAAIMMVLEDDEQIDDMTWYIGQNPQASEEELVAVAYQIVKEAHEK